MTTNTYVPPIIIDCEASGLQDESYPIEVGYAFPDGSVTSYLIKPEKTWTHWCESAAQIHNITLEQLHDEGVPAEHVALEMLEVLQYKRTFSDAPKKEKQWLRRLFDTIDHIIPFEVDHIYSNFTLPHQAKYYGKRKRELQQITTNSPSESLHRAGYDARLLQIALVLSHEDAINHNK